MEAKEVKKQTAQEVITRIHTPFTLGDLRDFVAVLADQPDTEPIEFKTGSNIFNQSSLTHRRRMDTPSPTDRLVAAVRDEPKAPAKPAEGTEDAMHDAWAATSHIPDYQVLLQFASDRAAKQGFNKYRGTACNWDGVRHIVSGQGGGSLILENGSVIRFGTKATARAGGWDLVIEVAKT